MFGWIDVGRGGGVIGASSGCFDCFSLWDAILGGFAGFSKGLEENFGIVYESKFPIYIYIGGLEIRNGFKPGQNLIKFQSFALYSKNLNIML